MSTSMTVGTRPVRPGEELRLRIDDLAFGGRGVAKHGGFVIFIEGALPGEVVRARVERVRRGYAEGVSLEVLSASPDRVAPPCPHFGDCGGCDLQHFSRRRQAESKRLQVETLLRRVAGLPDPPVREAVEAGDPLRYRFRMDFDWGLRPGGSAALGLHRRGRPAEILPIESCLLIPEPADRIRLLFARRAAALKLMPWDRARRRGLLRRLAIQMARATGEILVTVETGRGEPPALDELTGEAVRAFPRIVGVVRREFDRHDRLVGESILAGRDHLFEEVEGDRLKIPAGAFFQPNGTAWSILRELAVRELNPGFEDAVLELYCGVGFFTLPVARRCRQILAIESARDAVGAARDNAARAGIGNARFLCRDVDDPISDVLGDLKPGTVLVDPPRTGLAKATAQALLSSGAERIVYVSCDPATLARDLGILTSTARWRVRSVVPLDQFPQTHHVECVARIERSEG